MKKIEIIEYQDILKKNLHELTVEWIEKYFYLEQGDIEFLNDPKGAIIDKGGYIFFAKSGDEIMGTVSLIKKSEKVYELAKMAVTETAQGKGIGKKLMDKCIEISVEKGIEKFILYTNKKLIPAITLYRRYGFREKALNENKYIESDMYMELIISH